MQALERQTPPTAAIAPIANLDVQFFNAILLNRFIGDIENPISAAAGFGRRGKEEPSKIIPASGKLCQSIFDGPQRSRTSGTIVWRLGRRGRVPRRRLFVVARLDPERRNPGRRSAPSLVVLGLAAPRALYWPSLVWWKLVHVLGYVNARIILTVLFAVLLVPLSLVLAADRQGSARPAARQLAGLVALSGALPRPEHYTRMY